MNVMLDGTPSQMRVSNVLSMTVCQCVPTLVEKQNGVTSCRPKQQITAGKRYRRTRATRLTMPCVRSFIDHVHGRTRITFTSFNPADTKSAARWPSVISCASMATSRGNTAPSRTSGDSGQRSGRFVSRGVRERKDRVCRPRGSDGIGGGLSTRVVRQSGQPSAGALHQH